MQATVIIFWVIIFSISSAFTTVLLGNRDFLVGNLLSWDKFTGTVLHWRFIIAFFSAFIARYSFMIINNSILKIPHLSQNATTITAFITSIGAIFIILANYLFLGERVSLLQGVGIFIILLGTFIVMA